MDAADRMCGGCTINFEPVKVDVKFTAHLTFGPDCAQEDRLRVRLRGGRSGQNRP